MDKPTIEQIADFCKERGNNIDPEQFFYYYESKGWVIGKSPMKSWQACIRTWERNSTHAMAVKQRDEAYTVNKKVYMKPAVVKKKVANPKITKLTSESFALTGNLRSMTASQRIKARAKIRNIGKQIQLIKDNDSLVF